MNSMEDVINQAISDFDGIKAAIEEQGVNVPVGTDTSEYGNLIRRFANSIAAAFDELHTYAQALVNGGGTE